MPEAIVNYLSLLGWSPEENREIFSMDELIKNFNEKRISKSSSQYDLKKLKWFNHHYIENLSDEDYLNWVKKYFTYDVQGKSDKWLDTLLLVYKTHISYGKEINEVVKEVLELPSEKDAEIKEFMSSDASIKNTISIFKEEIEKTENWEVESLKEVINNVKEKAAVKGKMLYMPLRIVASGRMHGPDLPEVLYLIGKDKVLERISSEESNMEY